MTNLPSTMIDNPTRVYEDPALLEALGGVLRPGGLALTDEALAACRLPQGARVLDVGCGAGGTVAHLRERGLAAVGVDASAALLAAGRDRAPGAPLARARGEHLPLGDGVLDALLAECSLSLMPDVGAALAEVQRVLRPGGRLAISDVVATAELPPEWRDDPALHSGCMAGAERPGGSPGSSRARRRWPSRAGGRGRP